MGLLLYSMCTKHTFECGYSCTVCPENSPLNGSVLGRHAHPESPSLIWVCSHAVCLQMGLFCTVCRSRKSTYVWVGFFTVCLEVSPLYGSVLVQYVQREAQEVVGPPNRPGRRDLPFLCFPLVLVCCHVLIPQH